MEHTEGIVKYSKKPWYNWRNYYNWKLFINHGWRNAVLLAVSGADFLFEYEGANERYYFYELSLNENGEFSAIGRSVNKKRLPVKWKMAESMVDFEWQSA